MELQSWFFFFLNPHSVRSFLPFLARGKWSFCSAIYLSTFSTYRSFLFFVLSASFSFGFFHIDFSAPDKPVTSLLGGMTHLIVLSSRWQWVEGQIPHLLSFPLIELSRPCLLRACRVSPRRGTFLFDPLSLVYFFQAASSTAVAFPRATGMLPQGPPGLLLDRRIS